MYSGRLTQRRLWKNVLGLVTIIIVLAVFLYFAFFLASPFIEQQYTSVLGITVYILIPMLSSPIVKQIFNIQLVKQYPESCDIYYLHRIVDRKTSSPISSRDYPSNLYVQNPTLLATKKKIEQSTDEKLWRTSIYIKGVAGAGKSTAIAQFIKIISMRIRGRLSSLPSYRHPKLVILQQPMMLLDRGLNLPSFSEPVILVIEDLHRLEASDIPKLNEILRVFRLRNKKAIVICSSREDSHSTIPEIYNPLLADCSDTSIPGYDGFLREVIVSNARGVGGEPEIAMNDGQLYIILQHICSKNETPLYIALYFTTLREKGRTSLEDEDLSDMPSDATVMFSESWNTLDEKSRALLKSIKLLKTLRNPIEASMIPVLYRCYYRQDDYDSTLAKLNRSIWLSVQEGNVITHDLPFEWLPIDNPDSELEKLARLIVDDNESEQKTCIRTYPWIDLLLLLLGYQFAESIPSLAEICFRQVEIISSNETRLHGISLLMLGILLSNNMRFDEAEQTYRKAIELGTNQIMALINLGNLLEKNKRYDEAEQAFREAFEREPNQTIALGNLGNLLVKIERYDEAIQTIRKMVELDPNYAQAWFNLGVLLSKTNDADEAEQVFRKAIELEPDFTKAWTDLGVLLAKTERFDEAEQAFRKAIELESDDARPWLYLGIMLAKNKRYGEAEQAYREAIELGPNHAKVWNNLGNLLSDTERYNEAEQAYREAIEQEPDYADAWINLGKLFAENKRYDEAECSLRKAIELQPDNAIAYYFLGLVLIGAENSDEGCLMLHKAKKSIVLYPQLEELLSKAINEFCS